MQTQFVSWLCLLLLWPITWRQQAEEVLDLTQVKLKSEKKSGSAGGGGLTIGHSHEKKVIPLKVTLVSLNKTSYQLGDEVVYEILLENITTENVVIPWSADQGEPVGSGDIRGSIYLIAPDERKGDQLVALRGIVGSPSIPSSLKTLRPGQKVRIKAGGRWVFFDAEVAPRILTKLPAVFGVAGGFSLEGPAPYRDFKLITSSNKLDITLKRRSD
ncbi:MAG: hypothetical protein HYR56_05715 [Acidobacteria bacterium]|nr:hypothetical protein [Acidobacteriota bacterium]MBI3423493.1 hypothetical protein [Acidobacteriota bacterium]